MKQFIDQVKDRFETVLKIYEPYRPLLTKDELENFNLLQSCVDILSRKQGEIADEIEKPGHTKCHNQPLQLLTN